MKASPYAGKSAEPRCRLMCPKFITAYHTEVPDPLVPVQRVAFGTSGHRGSVFDKAFNEWHILAISQAICLYRETILVSIDLRINPGTAARGEKYQ